MTSKFGETPRTAGGEGTLTVATTCCKAAAGCAWTTGGGCTGVGGVTPGVRTAEVAPTWGVEVVTRVETVGDGLSGVETVGDGPAGNETVGDDPTSIETVSVRMLAAGDSD